MRTDMLSIQSSAQTHKYIKNHLYFSLVFHQTYFMFLLLFLQPRYCGGCDEYVRCFVFICSFSVPCYPYYSISMMIASTPANRQSKRKGEESTCTSSIEYIPVLYTTSTASVVSIDKFQICFVCLFYILLKKVNTHTKLNFCCIFNEEPTRTQNLVDHTNMKEINLQTNFER